MRLLTVLTVLALLASFGALAVALTRGGSPALVEREYTYVSRYSESDSITAKEVLVTCPRGMRLIYGGGSVGYSARMPTIALTRSMPRRDPAGDAWVVGAREFRPESRPWNLFAMAVCAPRND